MIDIFLMGTIGRSGWREPIKAACAEAGITCFDPAVGEWDERARRQEVQALQEARVIVMAILPDTASLASLAESGWVALSAMKRKQAFGLYLDLAAEFGDDALSNSMEDASMRARKLVSSHAAALKAQFTRLNVYLAESLQDLEEWAVARAKRLKARGGSRPTARKRRNTPTRRRRKAAVAPASKPKSPKLP
ncbi:MAG TPA: nucleoside 2-deoxyribosyltransferase domain-containing protein [Aggregatilineales bacterium]|nr:hypothetical protein [Anaerolineales bacterium]HRE48476.1 nucleoside 2-deoxyribosyltransferase domain-containing protein [Aggregatilineales bacterium]